MLFSCSQGAAHAAGGYRDGGAEEASEQDEDAAAQGQRARAPRLASPRLASSAAGCPLRVAALALIRRASSLVCAQWFAKARRQATLALSRGKGLKYDPLADPKYSFDEPEDDEDDDEEEDDDDE